MCHADDSDHRQLDHEMPLSYGHANEADIRGGIKRLGAVVRKFI